MAAPPILHSRLALSAEQLAAIGSVAVESSWSEFWIEEITFEIAGLRRESGKFFTFRMPMDKRLDLLGDLWKPKISDARKLAQFTKIISDLKEANIDRNTIIHGLWGGGADSTIDIESFESGGPMLKNPRALKMRLKDDPIVFSPENIEKTAEKIARLTEELIEFARANA